MQSIGAQYYYILTQVTVLTVYFAIAMAAEIGRNQYPRYIVYERLARGETHEYKYSLHSENYTPYFGVYLQYILCDLAAILP